MTSSNNVLKGPFSSPQLDQIFTRKLKEFLDKEWTETVDMKLETFLDDGMAREKITIEAVRLKTEGE